MAGIVLENLVKSYGKGKPVLKGIDLEIREREFMVLVGPSGCGKSTVLRVISGLEQVDSGTVRIGDRVVNDIPPRERDVAMVFQNYALYPHMTVYDNIAFGLRVRGIPKGEIDPLVRDAASILNLEPLLEKLPKRLSGGERQRVALGRAIVRKPKVFLFDEPLSNLDAKLRVHMRAEITALHRRLRITTVYVTHDQVEAMTMGERITVIRAGEIQQIDKPLDLYRRPANRFVAEFIGSPPMNILPARWDGSAVVVGNARFEAPEGSVPLTDAYRGKEVLLGVRPERLQVAPAGSGEGVPAHVDLVEPMGGESNIYLRIEGRRAIARIEGDAPVKAGENALVRIPAASAYFFDGESGIRIPGRNEPSESNAAPPPAPPEEPEEQASHPPAPPRPGRRRGAWLGGAAVLLLLLLVFLFRSGGERGGGEAGPGGGAAPITISIWQMMDPPEAALFEALAKEYESDHPGVKISHTHFAPDNLRTQYLTSALGGGGPDLVYGASDQVGPLSRAETILPVDEVWDGEYLALFVPIAFDTLEGHVWQLPARLGNHLTLLYNKALLPEPPSTLEGMVREGRRLTREGRYGLVFNIKEPFWLVPFLGAFGGWVMDDDYRPTLDTPAMVGCLRFLDGMRRGGRLMPDDCNYEVAHTLFQDGKAAMLINGPWSWKSYEEAGIDFGLAPIPKNEETGFWPSPMISSVGYSLNANLKGVRLERVKELVDFLTSPDVQIRYVETLWTIPTRKAALSDPRVKDHPRVAASWEQYRHGKRMPVVPEMRAIWDAMRPAYQNVLNGEMGPEEAARAMQADAEKKIKEMRGQ
ncbi:MAG: sn-glycerol-3-phosphate ABC transporter ATP-binding protein UgpC [Candidatus Eisenbacteria bacterium]